MFQADPSPNVTSDRIEEFNTRIWAVVAANGCVLVRLSDIALDQSMFSFDGFHPNNEGYQGMADLFWSEIEPLL
jgi:lysophospholipase L1-like esterase